MKINFKVLTYKDNNYWPRTILRLFINICKAYECKRLKSVSFWRNSKEIVDYLLLLLGIRFRKRIILIGIKIVKNLSSNHISNLISIVNLFPKCEALCEIDIKEFYLIMQNLLTNIWFSQNLYVYISLFLVTLCKN